MRFLSSASEIRTAIEETCRTAQIELALLSPFIRFASKKAGRWATLQKILRTTVPRLEQFIVITRSTRYYTKRRSTHFLKQLGAHFLALPNLHTKMVVSDSAAVMTSMNLHQHSVRFNQETGILIEQSDTVMLRETKDYVNELLADLTPDRPSRNFTENRPDWSTHQDASGYCIVCSQPMPYNPQKSLCWECYTLKKQYRGRIYGYYCHQCGEESSGITDRRPLCRECYFHRT